MSLRFKDIRMDACFDQAYDFLLSKKVGSVFHGPGKRCYIGVHGSLCDDDGPLFGVDKSSLEFRILSMEVVQGDLIASLAMSGE